MRRSQDGAKRNGVIPTAWFGARNPVTCEEAVLFLVGAQQRRADVSYRARNFPLFELPRPQADPVRTLQAT